MLIIVNTNWIIQAYTPIETTTQGVTILTNRLQNIGKNIRKIRKEKNIPQIELAVEIGIDRSYLSEIENGKTNLTINILYAISDALHTDITELLKKHE